jgi:hypothetical protein
MDNQQGDNQVYILVLVDIQDNLKQVDIQDIILKVEGNLQEDSLELVDSQELGDNLEFEVDNQQGGIQGLDIQV